MKIKIVEYGDGTFGIHRRTWMTGFLIEEVWTRGVNRNRWMQYAWVVDNTNVVGQLAKYKFETVEEAQDAIWNYLRTDRARATKPNEFIPVANVNVNDTEMVTNWIRYNIGKHIRRRSKGDE